MRAENSAGRVTTSNSARAVLVVSKDYGELGMAVSLLRGQELARGALMLLPEQLYRANAGTPEVSAAPYAGLPDILDAVADHDPDIVFLLSGYLMAWDRLVSPAELGTLVHHLTDRGAQVVTSDPYLGLAGHITLSQVDTRMLAAGRGGLQRFGSGWRDPWWASASRVVSGLLLRLRSQSRPLLDVAGLASAIHLYPTSAPERGAPSGARCETYYNPALVRATTPPAGGDRTGKGTGRTWLFVVSTTDFNCQRALAGLGGFLGRLARILQSALDAERQVTLIAPPPLVDLLSSFFAARAELLPFCPFADYERRLLEAEYVFVWNAFSFSILERFVNQLPVFFFDRGHLARTLGPFYASALRCHYGGVTPAYLDQTTRLDPAVLARLADQQRRDLSPVRERWRTSATPDALVSRLLHPEPVEGVP